MVNLIASASVEFLHWVRKAVGICPSDEIFLGQAELLWDRCAPAQEYTAQADGH